MSTPPRESSAEIEETLDEFFECALSALERGDPIPFEDFAHRHPGLVDRAERMAALARSLSGQGEGGPSISGYTLLSELGRGSMGVVYLARQDRLGGRPVALKVLPPHVSASVSARARFRAEVMAVARQSHPSIVTVHDIIEDGPHMAYSMEWIDGPSLSQVIAGLRERGAYAAIPTLPDVLATLRGDGDSGERPVGAREANFEGFVARLGLEIAAALDAVHANGIVHRDVKPSNILMRRDGSPLLSDFGLAKVTGEPTLTVGGGFLGTVGYASPEQLLGSEPGPGADVYALGATLQHLLTGAPPYDASTSAGAIEEIRRGEPASRLARAVAISSEMRRVIGRACALSPNDRYQTARDMASDLRALREPGTIWARSIGAHPRAARRRAWIACAAMLGAAIIGIASWRPWSGGTGQAPSDTPAPPAPGWSAPIRVLDPKGQAWDQFGRSVAGFGNCMIVGLPTADASPMAEPFDVGAASVFRYHDGAWKWEARLTPPQPIASASAGWSVALGDGVAVLGASGEPVDGVNAAGAAYVFRRDASGWSFVQRLTAATPIDLDGFGRYVSISGDIIGVSSTFRLNHIPVNQRPSDAGIVTLFKAEATGVRTLQTLMLPGVAFEDYPAACVRVALGGDLVFVSAAYCNIEDRKSVGKVGVFVRESPGTDRWRLAQEISGQVNAHGHFGDFLSSADTGAPGRPPRLLIGSPGWHLDSRATIGGVFVYESRDGLEGPWVETAACRPFEAVVHGIYGFRVAEAAGWRAAFQKTFPAAGPPRPRVLVHRVDEVGRAAGESFVLNPGSSDDDDTGVGLAMWHAPDGAVFLAVGQPGNDRPSDGLNAKLQDSGAVWVWRIDPRKNRSN